MKNEIKVAIAARPEGENPIYYVGYENGSQFTHIQRIGGISFDSWYEVALRNRVWRYANKSDETAGMGIAFTKEEAIKIISERFAKDAKEWNLAEITEKAEIFNALTLKEKEQFLKVVPAKYKDRIIAESMKLKDAEKQPIEQTNRPSQNAKMAKILNSAEVEDAFRKIAKMKPEEVNPYLATLHPISAKKVADLVKTVLAQANKDKQNNSQTTPSISNKMADEAKKTRSAPVQLDPANNKTHKVLLGLSKLHVAAKGTGFKGFDKKNLKEKQQKLDGKDLLGVYERQFQTFRRKFLIENGQTVTTKPLANPENPLHDKAIAILREMMTEGKEKGGQAIADNAESWLSRIETVYATEKKGGTGRKATKFDPADTDFWSF
jgi:hypothetical protein